MKWWSLVGLLPFLLSAGLALAFALTFKTLRRRMSRRSPLAGRKIGKLRARNSWSVSRTMKRTCCWP